MISTEILKESIPIFPSTNAEIINIMPALEDAVQLADEAIQAADFTRSNAPTLAESLVLITNQEDLKRVHLDDRFGGQTDRVRDFYDDVSDLCFINLDSVFSTYSSAKSQLKFKTAGLSVG